jgi:predicted dehydrogenase
VATIAALKSGKHVYCEKPLTHSVWEVRQVIETAAQTGLATQMGTQIHAGDNYRRVVELIRAGAIGEVREVHAWCGTDWSGGPRPKETPRVPEGLSWDVWLGPAPSRPYNPAYHPASWRGYWDFGGGGHADMACHFMDVAHWALELRRPLAVEASGPPVDPEHAPNRLTVVFEYPARAERPPVRLTWAIGSQRPDDAVRDKVPDEWKGGVLFVGDKGMLLTDYGRHVLLPEKDFVGFKRPEPSIPASIGHHREWIKACKEGGPTTCNFDYSGALTETVLLGNVAYRSGMRIEWDAEEMKIPNAPEAEKWLRRAYREGWSL